MPAGVLRVSAASREPRRDFAGSRARRRDEGARRVLGESIAHASSLLVDAELRRLPIVDAELWRLSLRRLPIVDAELRRLSLRRLPVVDAEPRRLPVVEGRAAPPLRVPARTNVTCCDSQSRP